MNKKLTVQSQIQNMNIKMNSLMQRLQGKNTQESFFDDSMKTLFIDIDIQQSCNRYKWGGLPDNLQGWLIEHMLYYRGALAGYFKGGILYVLPYAQTGGINTYGLPNAVNAIAYNGVQETESSNIHRDLLVGENGTINSDAEVAILYDRIPSFYQGAKCIPRFILIDKLIELQAEIMQRIKVNLWNSTAKYVVWVDNESEVDAMRDSINTAFSSHNPFVVCVRGSTDFTNKEQFTASVELETQTLFEALESVNSIRLQSLGINTNGIFEKKERVVTAEVETNGQETDLTDDVGLAMRKLWIEQMKVIYASDPSAMDILNKITVESNKSNQDYTQPLDDDNDSEEGDDNDNNATE